MTFTTTALVGERVLVEGTDSAGTNGQCIVSSAQWTDINGNKAYDKAEAAFNQAVAEFFEPLTAAAEQVEASLKRTDDPVSYVVLSEEVEGQAAKPAHLIRLDRDSIILRIIESGDTNRLRWVDGQLEVLEVSAQVEFDYNAVDVSTEDYVS